ncbi:MAG: hypothetical protein Q3983_04270 [Capnocytophaga sp.]|nr:hypothetical protein [Capnocytophaga sp.]
MKLFPTIEEVFRNPLPVYKTIFFPLLTIDLGTDMNKEKGKVHFVSVLGNPYNYLITNEVVYGFDFIKFDWDGTHYQFDNSRIDTTTTTPLLDWYASVEKDYLTHQAEYLSTYTYEQAKESHLRQQIQEWKATNADFGSYAEMLLSYWITRDKYLETGKFIRDYGYYGQNDEVNKPTLSLSKSGVTTRADELIGKVCGYYYIEDGESEIKLSIDRKKQQVIQKFYWD